ncbi:hypothetical protein PDIDSM_5325, partial [Penicillium digitatum]
MTDTLRISTVRFPPLRQARGRRLSSFHTYTAVISPKLRLQTSGFAIPTHARLARLMSPLSAGTTSSCSDTEWQSQMQGFRGYDDLYDASGDDSDDNETEISDSCFSPDTRPSSLITPVTRNSVTSTGSQKHPLILEIPRLSFGRQLTALSRALQSADASVQDSSLASSVVDAQPFCARIIPRLHLM